MSDPLLAIVLIPLFLALLAAASWFKTLDPPVGRESRVPLLTGVVSGILLYFGSPLPIHGTVLIGVILTAAALYVRHTGKESEPVDGMLLGALSGASAAALFLFEDDALTRFAQYVLAAAVSGYGITFGISHIRERPRQLIFDGGTALVAVAAAWVPLQLRDRFSARELALGTAMLVPLMAIAAVFRQWPLVAAELKEESEHGLIDPADVRTTSHPLLRLARSGWHSSGARREFVRIATRLALRKYQQRNRPPLIARIYQIEVIKLRMEMQEMVRVDRAMRAATLRQEPVEQG